jgi:alkyl hydroperoxide reductase subunit D
MMNLDEIRERIPVKDLALNLSSVLGESALTEDQKWGVALACAITSGNAQLRDAIAANAKENVADDARAAAALMAMNNVYYRFRHFAGKPSYAQKGARLRMQRIAKPATDKASFELMCLAVSAINGCEVCVKSHEAAVIESGLSEDAVHDAVRIAATIRGAATALF